MESSTVWITALLSFIGALAGSFASVRYARRTAYERSLGEESARRKLDLVEKLAGLLSETIELLDQHEGADSVFLKGRETSAVLDEFERMLPLAHIYLGAELHGLLRAVRFWVFVNVNPHTNFVKPEKEPDFSRAWSLLAAAVRGRIA